MRKAGAIAAVIIVTLVLIGSGFYVMELSRDARGTGFDPTELSKPSIANLDSIDNSLPTPLTGTIPSYDDLSLYWNITEDIYAGYGGALDLTVENQNPGKLYVYAYGLQWVSSGESYYRNCSVTIDHGQTKNLGLLLFGAPSIGHLDYEIVLKVAASNALGTAWHDVGELPSSVNSALVKALGHAAEVEIDFNTMSYYNRVNERVSFSDAQAVASIIKAKYPGSYSVLQIAEAFAWVKANVGYLADPPGDYWQTTRETLDLRTGDCEDQAILMASIIGALGGSSRVNLIDEHAFPTVFVASNYTDLLKVKNALATYYGVDVATYKMSYLTDQYGYWLVIDTAGFPYAGGVPAKSEPTSTNGNWTVLSNFIHQIDATGVASSSGVFGLI